MSFSGHIVPQNNFAHVMFLVEEVLYYSSELRSDLFVTEDTLGKRLVRQIKV